MSVSQALTDRAQTRLASRRHSATTRRARGNHDLTHADAKPPANCHLPSATHTVFGPRFKGGSEPNSRSMKTTLDAEFELWVLGGPSVFPHAHANTLKPQMAKAPDPGTTPKQTTVRRDPMNMSLRTSQFEPHPSEGPRSRCSAPGSSQRGQSSSGEACGASVEGLGLWCPGRKLSLASCFVGGWRGCGLEPKSLRGRVLRCAPLDRLRSALHLLHLGTNTQAEARTSDSASP